MGKRRILILAAITVLIAACSTAPTTQLPRATPPARSTPNLNGTWVLTTHSRMGAEEASMTVKQAGGALAGKLTNARGSFDYSGSVQGNAVGFSFTLSGPGNNLKIDYSGTVEGDTMQGKTVFGSFGEGTFSAKRTGS